MKKLKPPRRSHLPGMRNQRAVHGYGPTPLPALALRFETVRGMPGRLIIVVDYCRQWSFTVPRTPAKKRRISAQPPVLSKKARAYAKKVEGSRQLSIKFLKEAGIIEKPGKFARHYR